MLFEVILHELVICIKLNQIYLLIIKKRDVMKFRLALFLLSLMYQVALLANSREVKLAYIERYRSIVVEEMHRSGIPASIKMAQAILESNAGTSTLAKQANNHFGIKCGNDWPGKEYFRKDDDYHRGKLVQSCFRVYQDAESSFTAHSNFLTSQPRYSFLFNLKKDDYRAWATGLRKAGYATDPAYSQNLIQIIEMYRLYEMDGLDMAHNYQDEELLFLDEVNPFHASRVKMINKTKVVNAQPGMTLEDVALNYGLSLRQLYKYNDHLIDNSAPFTQPTLVYLEPKKAGYKAKQKVHLLKSNESLGSVSQLYGIRLEKLYHLNRLELKAQPAPGSKIYLRKRAPKNVRWNLQAEPTFTQPEKPDDRSLVTAAPSVVNPTLGVTQAISPAPERRATEQKQIMHYYVKSGDTLYSISREFGINLEDLKRVNNLNDAIIKVGQKLQVSL